MSTPDNFRAYRIDERDGKIVAGFQQLSVDDLTEGNVVVRVSHSTINYKDALAATGAGKILRRYPLNGGIDLAGTVVSSEDNDFEPGMPVLVNGCGLSETRDGGYSEYARVDSESLVPIPAGLDAGNIASARDLVRLVHAAMGYPFIREATTTREISVRPWKDRGELRYVNTNRLLKNAAWEIHLSKTGYLNEAGRCLAMQAEIIDRPLTIVLLNSFGKLTPFGDSNRIRKWIQGGLGS